MQVQLGGSGLVDRDLPGAFAAGSRPASSFGISMVRPKRPSSGAKIVPAESSVPSGLTGSALMPMTGAAAVTPGRVASAWSKPDIPGPAGETSASAAFEAARRRG